MSLVFMEDPRKHHFIPAFYLKGWATLDGNLIEWSKPYKKVVPMRRHPKATAFQRDLYAFPELPLSMRQWFEKEFLKFTDDVACSALPYIISGRMKDLSETQKTGWVRFLMTLRFRHPDAVKEIREGTSKLWPNSDIFTEDIYTQMRSSKDPNTYNEYIALIGEEENLKMKLELFVAVMDNAQIGQQILNMPWCRIDLTSASRRLLTSDWPVDLIIGGNPARVIIPLSPKFLFVACEDVNAINGLINMDQDKLVENVNTYVVGRARRYVFSSDERQKRFIENRIYSDMQPQPLFPSLTLSPTGDELVKLHKKLLRQA